MKKVFSTLLAVFGATALSTAALAGSLNTNAKCDPSIDWCVGIATDYSVADDAITVYGDAVAQFKDGTTEDLRLSPELKHYVPSDPTQLAVLTEADLTKAGKVTLDFLRENATGNMVKLSNCSTSHFKMRPGIIMVLVSKTGDNAYSCDIKRV